MNSPEGEIGGLMRGAPERWGTRGSGDVLPPAFEGGRGVSMKKLLGSRRRSKYMMSSWPRGVIASHGWNWSAVEVFGSWFTRTGPEYVWPPFVDLSMMMSEHAGLGSVSGSLSAGQVSPSA